MSGKPGPDPLELWGGIECTINRLGDRFIDQQPRFRHSLQVFQCYAVVQFSENQPTIRDINQA